jgi:23S rRNA pseudouridine955/2504/2580 synthase
MKRLDFEDIILFENEDYLLVNKPAHVSTLEDRNDPENMLSLARAYADDAQACHRLDKETSGVLAFAKHPEAYRHLAIQFENRKVQKVYHAIADGIHDFQDEKVSLPIQLMGKGIVRISRQEGKPAETWLKTLQAYRQHTLVECRPVTGRMHQIRIHLSALNAPISCDETYGGKPLLLSKLKRNFNLKKDTEEQPIIKRVALHAYELRFEGLGGEPLKVQAPYPKDFAVAIKQLEKNI